MRNKEHGITLVALVITIIILLILAGVAITALTQTGLFENARQAKNATENAQIEENVILGSYENKINEVAGGVSGSSQKTFKIKNANITNKWNHKITKRRNRKTKITKFNKK